MVWLFGRFNIMHLVCPQSLNLTFYTPLRFWLDLHLMFEESCIAIWTVVAFNRLPRDCRFTLKILFGYNQFFFSRILLYTEFFSTKGFVFGHRKIKPVVVDCAIDCYKSVCKKVFSWLVFACVIIKHKC